jgi:hypothetical protein
MPSLATLNAVVMGTQVTVREMLVLITLILRKAYIFIKMEKT